MNQIFLFIFRAKQNKINFYFSAELIKEQKDIILKLRMRNVLGEKYLERVLCNYFTKNKTFENVTLFLKLSTVFNLQSIAQETFKIIERCFISVVETKNFLKLNAKLVEKIFLSSELFIDSELEVLKAAGDWISFNEHERTKFAKRLLLAARLPLLSDAALNHSLSFSICKNDACRSLVESVVLDRKNFFVHRPKANVDIRHCSQSSFEIYLAYGQRRNLKRVGLGENNSAELGCSVEKNEKIYKAVASGGDVYVVASKIVKSKKKMKKTLVIKKYWSLLESWETVAELKHRKKFAVCSFMSSVFIVGGLENRGRDYCASAMRYDAKLGKTIEIDGTKLPRSHLACAVFDGRVVASGGFIPHVEHYSVEAFDCGRWKEMPDMTRRNYDHQMVAIKNKLFVIPMTDRGFEVFDKSANCFASILSSTLNFDDIYEMDTPGAVLMGKKIVIFGRREKTVVFYDTEKDEWYQESCENLNTLRYRSCVKVAQI